MAISRNREKRSRQPSIRHRPEGTPVPEVAVDDEQSYIDVEYDQHGALVTDPDTIPRNV